jgi:hypothetical protein
MRAITATTLSVFALRVLPEDFCITLYFYPLTLFSFPLRAERDKIFFPGSSPCVCRAIVLFLSLLVGCTAMAELPIIQKTYDLIKWYIPILNRLPRDHRFTLGERIIQGLYDLLEGFIQARYSRDKMPQLETINRRLEILRYQSRLLLDFNLISEGRYEHIAKQINAIGIELGGWINQQRQRQESV